MSICPVLKDKLIHSRYTLCKQVSSHISSFIDSDRRCLLHNRSFCCCPSGGVVKLSHLISGEPDSFSYILPNFSRSHYQIRRDMRREDMSYRPRVSINRNNSAYFPGSSLSKSLVRWKPISTSILLEIAAMSVGAG